MLPIPKEMNVDTTVKPKSNKTKIDKVKDNIIDIDKVNISKNIGDKIYDMYQNKKMPIQTISREKGLTKMKVEYYIVKAYKIGKILDLDRLGFTDECFNCISAKFKDLNNPTKLSIIRNELPRKYTYLHIKLTMILMNNKNNKNNDITNIKIYKEKVKKFNTILDNINNEDIEIKSLIKNTTKKYIAMFKM